MIPRLIIIAAFSLLGVSETALADNVKGILIPVIGQSETLSIGNGTAQKGEVIFSQTLTAQKTATIATPFYLQRDNRFKSEFNITTDDVLYAVLFPKYDVAYCSVKTGYSQSMMGGKRWNSQICLIDKDKNGTFDHEYAGAIRKFDSSPLSLGMMWSDDLGIGDLPYMIAGPQAEASVNARVELSRLSSRSLNFKVMVQWVEGDWVEHGEEKIKLSKDTEFPIEADVYGAKIRIHSIDNQVINYQVLSGFSETDTIMLE